MSTDVTPQTSKHPTRHRVTRQPGQARMPRLGKIRLGDQQQSSRTKKMYPRALDYFVVVEDESGITPAEAVAAFREVYGEQPKRLHVVMPAHTPEECFESAYRLYGASKVKRICSGTTCSLRTPLGWQDQPCQCRAEGLDPDATPRDEKACKLIHTLNMVLPDVRGLGVWQLDSGSEIGERNMSDYLAYIYGLRGSLLGHEFDLELAAVKVAPVVIDQKTGEASTTSKTVYVLKPVPQYEVSPRELLEQAATGGTVVDVPRGLPAPTVDTDRDHLISPTPEAQATAAAEAAPLEDAITNAFKALSPEEQNELVALVPADVLTAGLLADLYRDEARDLKMLLARLRADALTQPTGLSVDPDPPPSDDRPSSPRSVSEESSEQLTVGGEDESA